MALIVFSLEDGTEIETGLDADVITVGRHADSIVVLPSASVSSHHAIIKRRGESFFVQDLGTTNGTKLNGVEVEEAKLSDGDQLQFGSVPAVFHLSEPVKVIPVAALPTPVAPPTGPTSIHPIPSMRGGPPVRSGFPGRPYKRPVQKYKESSGCASAFSFIVFLIVAFVVGLHLRHYQENPGHTLILDLLKKFREGVTINVGNPSAARSSDEKEPATPAPTPAPAPAIAPAKPPGDEPAPSMDGK